MVKFKHENIRKLRKKHKLTVYAFGKKLGNKPNFVIVGWESGKIVPTVPSIEKMCDEFGVDPNYFFT